MSKESNKYLIYDLEQRNPRVLEQAEFEELYQGNIILITSRTSIIGKLAKFDFTWFIPAIIKYRKIFIETLVVSIFLQLFALITPLFFSSGYGQGSSTQRIFNSQHYHCCFICSSII